MWSDKDMKNYLDDLNYNLHVLIISKDRKLAAMNVINQELSSLDEEITKLRLKINKHETENY